MFELRAVHEVGSASLDRATTQRAARQPYRPRQPPLGAWMAGTRWRVRGGLRSLDAKPRPPHLLQMRLDEALGSRNGSSCLPPAACLLTGSLSSPGLRRCMAGGEGRPYASLFEQRDAFTFRITRGGPNALVVRPRSARLPVPDHKDDPDKDGLFDHRGLPKALKHPRDVNSS